MLIRGTNIHVGNGEVLTDHDILVEDGLITRIDKNIEYTGDTIIQGEHVFPGFIDPISSYGSIDLSFYTKDNNETSNPINPDLEIKYSFNPAEIKIEELNKVGITSIGGSPGNLNVIGGDISVFNTNGISLTDFTVRENVGLKGAVTEVVKSYYKNKKTFPMTRMGIFKALEDWKRETEEKKDETSISYKVLAGEKPFFVHANTETEIKALLNFFKDTKVKLVLIGAYDFHKCVEDIIAYKDIAVVIGEQTNLNIAGYHGTDLSKVNDLLKEDILVSLTLSGEYAPEGRVKYLWNAIEFFKAGVASEDVIKCMTSNPAKILGVDDKIGRLEEGKSADLVVYDKNPIEFYDSNIEYTIIKGNIVSEGGLSDATY